VLLKIRVEGGLMDNREKAVRRVGNKLSKEERQRVLAVPNSKEYADLPPCKIVPLLADDGIYIASESSFYRILRQEKLLSHRQQTRPATQHRLRLMMPMEPIRSGLGYNVFTNSGSGIVFLFICRDGCI